MKNPHVDYQALVTILGEIPRGTPWMVVLFGYIIAVLLRNNGNRTQSAKDLKMSLRSLRHRMWCLGSLGFDIPPPTLGVKKTR